MGIHDRTNKEVIKSEFKKERNEIAMGIFTGIIARDWQFKPVFENH